MMCMLHAMAQDGVKTEREKAGSKSEVPGEAVDWLEGAAELPKRVTWYREENNEGVNYEAKFKPEGDMYSVKFSDKGCIEDIEIAKPWKKLPDGPRKNMDAYFNSTYTRFKLDKAQLQYTGDGKLLKTVFAEDGPDENLTVRYEVEYRGKTAEGHNLWESMFDSEGSHLSRRKVVMRPIDNLSY